MITFIIPAHNEEFLIGRTISALHTAAGAMNEPYEIIVVDDASTDTTSTVSLQIMSHNLNVDGSRQPKIQNLADHVSGQESERNTRELPRECQAQLVNVVVGGTVISGQSHQNVGVRCANRSRVAVREIN